MQVDLKLGVMAALRGDWEQAHRIVQESDHLIACWIHAVLHKIEKDEGNSRYWYSRAHRSFDEYADPTLELKAIASYLENNLA